MSIAQTMLVAKAVQEAFPGTETELVCRRTMGDRILDKPLLAFGGKGVFVSEFEEALLSGEIDFAVHSAKDIPLELAEGLRIVGVLPRGDVRDVLVTRKGESRDNPLIKIGTSSLRRKIQMEEWAERMIPEKRVVCENLRGNVLTRLDKLRRRDYDGIILAAAGLERLNLTEDQTDYQFYYFSEKEMIPAGGQGILAVEGRESDEKNYLIEKISDPLTMVQLSMERKVLSLLNAGCHEPIGVYCHINGKMPAEIELKGIYEKNGRRFRAAVKKEWGKNENPEKDICQKMAEELAVQLSWGQRIDKGGWC